MAYERYIKKGGKVYGPYLQHNKKVDGKVVTEYRGKIDSSVKGFNHGNLLLFGLLGLILIISLVAFANFNLTGKVSLDIKSKYVGGETLDGNLKFSLKEGELIPADSKIVLELGGNVQEYLLSDFISLDFVDGIFYAEGTELSGEGSGYGLIGSRKIYPEVSFEMEIVEKGKGKKEKDEIIEKEVEVPELEEVLEEEIVGPEGEISGEVEEDIVAENEEEVAPEETSEEVPEQTGAVSEEPTTMEIPETPTETPAGIAKVTEESSVTKAEEKEAKKDETAAAKEEKKAEKVEEKSSGDGGSVSITGGVISKNVISGTVSKGNDFEYSLDDGKIAELVDGSVEASGHILDDGVLKLKNNKDGVVVSTDYYYDEEGFGEDYVGSSELKFTINLEEFGLVVGEDTMFTIRLISDEIVLVEASKDVSVSLSVDEDVNTSGKDEINDTEIEIIINETEIEEIVSNETINFTDILLNINTTQYGAVLGKPVKWKKNVKLEKEGKVNVELPKQAENITVYKVVDEEREELEQGEDNLTIELEVVASNQVSPGEGVPQGETSSSSSPSENEDINTEGKQEDIDLTEEEIIVEPVVEINETIIGSENVTEVVSEEINEVEELNVTKTLITAKVISGEVTIEIVDGFSFAGLFRKIFRAMTGRVVDVEEKEESTDVIIDDNATEYDIEYQTPGPIAIETPTAYGKEIVISSDVHYENILAYTLLPTEMPSGVVKMYWITQENVTIELNETSEFCVNETFIELVCEFDSEINESICENISSVNLVCEDVPVVSYEMRDVQKLVPIVETDWDENGLVDYIEWVVPSLSSQTYNLYVTNETGANRWSNGTFYQTKNNIENVSLDDNDTLQEMPSNQVDGAVNMTGNVLLMHFNNDTSVGENFTHVYDYSGEGNNGTWTSGASNVTGKLGDYSGSFDGVDDYVDVSDSDSLDFGTGDFSVGFWVNSGNLGAVNREIPVIMKTSSYASIPGFYIDLTTWGGGATSYGIDFGITNSATFADNHIQTPIIYDVNVWYYVVIYRSSTTIKIFVDGVEVATKTHSALGQTVTNALPLQFAKKQAWQNIEYPGSIDEVAIWNRSLSADEILNIYNRQKSTYLDVGNYTSETFDAAGLGSWSGISWGETQINGTEDNNTKLLLHADGADGGTTFIDSAQGRAVTANGNANTSTNQFKFGNASGGFDGTGDYLTVPDSDDWYFGTGNFTIDFWMYPTDNSDRMIWGQGSDPNDLSIYLAGDRIVLRHNDVEIYVYTTATPCFSLNEWTHVAVVRYGTGLGETAIYVNGKSQPVTNMPANQNIPNFAAAMTIGQGPYYSTYQGYLDEFRISKGTARWTANFTVPKMAYPVNLTNITLQTRTSNDNSDWTSWSSNQTNPSGIINESARYLQYRAEFSTDDTSYTPYLEWVNVSYNLLIGDPTANRFSVQDSSGANVASIDEDGDMFLKGTLSQSQGVLNPTANSFVVQNSSAHSVAYFNSTGSLFLAGAISTGSDLTGLTSTNMEIRNSTNDVVAFFDNVGNLKLRGGYAEGYASP